MSVVCIAVYSVSSRRRFVHKKIYRFAWRAALSAFFWRTASLPGFVILGVKVEKT